MKGCKEMFNIFLVSALMQALRSYGVFYGCLVEIPHLARRAFFFSVMLAKVLWSNNVKQDGLARQKL